VPVFDRVMHAGQESGGEKAISIGPVDPAVARKAYNAAQKRGRTKVTDNCCERSPSSTATTSTKARGE